MGGKLQFLPPAKRFMLMQQQQQQQEEHNNNGVNHPIPTNIPSLSSLQLPAKKRKFSPETTGFPDTTPFSNSTFCLPAKKRVWAFHPFDLNVEYNPVSNFDDEPKEQKLPQDTFISQPESENSDTHVEEEENNETHVTEEENNDTHVTEEENNEDEDGIVCAICDSTDGDPSDPIVLCDGCDLMVHTSCYGHPFTEGIPEGDWFCAKCLAIKSSETEHPKPVTCCLCPETGGALKPTTKDGKWAHVICALFVPEVFFADSEGREGIDFSKVPKRRWEQKCYICKTRNGCAIDCSEPKCPLSFHVTCGLKRDLCIEYKEGRNKGAVVAGFCSSHTELWKKQQQTGKFKIVPRDELDR